MSAMHEKVTLDLRKLRYALTLASCGSYVKASEVLHITQSALTRSVQALEAQYGLILFDRGRAGVRPTASGRLLLERAEQILAAARGLESDLHLINEHDWGQVAFGMGPLPAGVLLPRLLTDMALHHPGVRLRSEINGARYLLEHLRDERIEFLVCARGHVTEAPHLRVEPLVSLPLALLVRAAHPLAGLRSVPASRLQPFVLVSGSMAESAGSTPLEIPGAAKLPWPPTISCDDFEALRQVTLGSDVLWLTSPRMVRADLKTGSLVQLSLRETPGEAAQVLVCLAGRSMSPTAQLVMDKITQLLTPETVGKGLA